MRHRTVLAVATVMVWAAFAILGWIVWDAATLWIDWDRVLSWKGLLNEETAPFGPIEHSQHSTIGPAYLFSEPLTEEEEVRLYNDGEGLTGCAWLKDDPLGEKLISCWTLDTNSPTNVAGVVR